MNTRLILLQSCVFVQHRIAQIGLKETAKKVIFFHHLPVKRKKLGKTKAETKSSCQKKNTFNDVCSDHFTDDCFEMDHRHNILGGKTRKRKKQPDAVATIIYDFIFNKDYNNNNNNKVENRTRTRCIIILVDKVPSSLFSDSGTSPQQTHSLEVFRTSHLPHKHQFKFNSLSAP